MQNIEISRFDMQRDLLTRTGEREIGAVSRRLPDNPGELAYNLYVLWAPWILQVPSKVASNILHAVTNILGLSTD